MNRQSCWKIMIIVLTGVIVTSVLADVNPTQAAKDCFNRGDYNGFASYWTKFDRSDVDIQFMMGWCLANDKGFSPGQYQNALGWYESAAKQGSSAALNNIGDMYERGLGVPVNYQKAGEYYLKSAQMNNAWGNRNYGRLVELGKGFNIDLNVAKGWYQAAVKIGGCPYAQEDLNRVMGKLQNPGGMYLDVDVSSIKWGMGGVIFDDTTYSRDMKYKQVDYECACGVCGGEGKVKCNTCEGTGYCNVENTGIEAWFSKTRKSHCWNCSSGKITCNACKGTGKFYRHGVRYSTEEERIQEKKRRELLVWYEGKKKEDANTRYEISCNLCGCEFTQFGSGMHGGCRHCPHKPAYHKRIRVDY